jgi:PAS domain S-box-containing protein
VPVPSSVSVLLSRAARWVLGVIGLALVYYAVARLGLRYASVGQSISLIWPPTGLAIAALVILRPSVWPGVTIGAFLANAATAVPLAAAAGIALGNTLEAVVAAALLTRAAGPRPKLDAMATVRALVLVAAPIGAALSAVVGVLALTLTGALPPAGSASAIAVWWTGDLLGALVVAPLLLAWILRQPSPRPAHGLLEVLLLCLGTVLAAQVGLAQVIPVPPLFRGLNYPYLLFPFVVWAALRFGSRGATLMTITVALVSVGRTVQGGGPFNMESGGGTLFSVAVYLGLVSVTGLLLAAVASHEREAALEELHRRDEQLRVALAAASMGVWYWSAGDDRLTWDEPLRRMYGVRPDQRIERYEDFIGRVHPDDREMVEAKVRRALSDGGRLDYEFRIVLPDGRTRWIADQGRAVQGERGIVDMTGTCMDITDRRNAEEQLRLAHRMESVGRLAGGVAHEANNQMSVVIGAVSFILRRPDLPPAVRADAEHIRAAAERTAAVTAQLLAFSRRQVLRPQRLELSTVLEHYRPVLARTMGEDCPIALRLGQAPAVRMDPGQLEQVLLNLALNARDAMPLGGTLTIETSTVELAASTPATPRGVTMRPGQYALLAVSDTGHGMDRETLSHVFEPFFTTKGLGRGTGLGLATVYGIVKQSGGYIWAYSEPGQGTTIKIYLPVSDEPAASAGDAEPAAPRAAGGLVLVVEDDPAVRTMAVRALADAGYRVLEAESGARALELLAGGERPALVLSDVVMPGISGSALASRIAEIAPGTPVLYTSGYTDGEIVRRGLLEPGVVFVPKPFSPDGLVRAVAERIEGGRA